MVNLSLIHTRPDVPPWTQILLEVAYTPEALTHLLANLKNMTQKQWRRHLRAGKRGHHHAARKLSQLSHPLRYPRPLALQDRRRVAPRSHRRGLRVQLPCEAEQVSEEIGVLVQHSRGLGPQAERKVRVIGDEFEHVDTRFSVAMCSEVEAARLPAVRSFCALED